MGEVILAEWFVARTWPYSQVSVAEWAAIMGSCWVSFDYSLAEAWDRAVLGGC